LKEEATRHFKKSILFSQRNKSPPSKWVKENEFDTLFHWLPNLICFSCILFQFFSCIDTSLLMNVGTYSCKLLHLYWCNINEIELIFNFKKITNYWEISRTKAFANLKNHFQTCTKWFIREKKFKTKTKVPFKIKNQTSLNVPYHNGWKR
jgi:hypothetical protein